MNALATPDDLERELRAIGEERYHNKHPFHQLLNAGELSKAQVQAWALNRYYYQACIPIKDATLLARLEEISSRTAHLAGYLGCLGAADATNEAIARENASAAAARAKASASGWPWADASRNAASAAAMAAVATPSVLRETSTVSPGAAGSRRPTDRFSGWFIR